MKRLWGTALLLMLVSAGMWFAWLGWDHEYYLVNGVAQGPYRPWQVVGCGAAVVAATVVAYLRVRRKAAIFVLAAAAVIGFAVPWSRDAAATDDTGMWGVGLIMIVIGGGLGLGLLLTITHLLTDAPRSPSYLLAVCGGLTVLTLLVYPPLALLPLGAAAWVFFHSWLPDHRALRH